MNIFDAIAEAAAAHPQRVALVAGTQAYSYQGLVRITGVMAQRLWDAGVKAGDVVVLRSTDPCSLLLQTLALARLGAISLATVLTEGLDSLLPRCGATAAICGSSASRAGLPAQLPVLDEAALLAPVPTAGPDFASCDLAEDAGWRIALSSGTTGQTKAMRWTHGGSRAYAQSLDEAAAPLGGHDRVLVFADVGSAYAMHRILHTLARGAALLLPANPAPAELVRCLDLYGATQLVTVVSLALQLLRHVQASGDSAAPRFPSLAQMLVAGEAISPALRAALRSHICPQLRLSYGASECGPIAIADAALQIAQPRAAGRLRPGCAVQVLGPQGQALPAGQVGTLRVRTPGMVQAYLGDAEQSARVFRDGWYLTGDRGHIDAQGVLHLGARVEDCLLLQGALLDPMAIEAVIEALPGVHEVVVFLAQRPGAPATPPALVLAALYVAAVPLAADSVRAHCAAQLPLAQQPVLLVQVPELPRTANGKLSRRDLTLRLRWDATAPAAA